MMFIAAMAFSACDDDDKNDVPCKFVYLIF